VRSEFEFEKYAKKKGTKVIHKLGEWSSLSLSLSLSLLKTTTSS
jgi:hypothetical protein